jgi:aryl-alcohol dehydrogenase-like predicted oxidoreductase
MGFLKQWDDNKKDWEPKLKTLQKLAKDKLGCSLAQLSIAWVIKNKDISTTIMGAKTPEQLKENLKALEIVPKLTKEILEEIEKVMGNAPKGEIDYFNNFAPLPTRRETQK